MRISTQSFHAVTMMGSGSSDSFVLPKHPHIGNLKTNYINWTALRSVGVSEVKLQQLVSILLSDHGPRNIISRDVMLIASKFISDVLNEQEDQELLKEKLREYQSIKDAAIVDNWCDQELLDQTMQVISSLLPTASDREVRALMFLAHRQHLMDGDELNEALALSTDWLFLQGGLTWEFYLDVDKKYRESRVNGDEIFGEFPVELASLKTRHVWAGAVGQPAPLAPGPMPGNAAAVVAPPSGGVPAAAAAPPLAGAGATVVSTELKAIASGDGTRATGQPKKRSAAAITPFVGDKEAENTRRRLHFDSDEGAGDASV